MAALADRKVLRIAPCAMLGMTEIQSGASGWKLNDSQLEAQELHKEIETWQSTLFTEKSRGRRSSAASTFWPTP